MSTLTLKINIQVCVVVRTDHLCLLTGLDSVLWSSQASGRMLRRMASLPSRSQSPGCGTVSPSRISMRTSQGSTYDSPVLSEPKPLAAVFPGTSMPPSCPSPTSPTNGAQALGGGGGAGRLGSTLSLVEGRGPTGSPLRSGMTAVPQHYGSTLPRQSQPLAYGADPYGLYQRSALPRPDSLIGQSGAITETHRTCAASPKRYFVDDIRAATIDYLDPLVVSWPNVTTTFIQIPSLIM